MGKLIAYRANGDRVFLALMNNGAVLETVSGAIAGTKNTDEEVSNAVRELMERSGIRASEGAAVLSDNSCIMKEIDVTGITSANLAMNLPYDFGEYIAAGQEINFVFDYQVLPMPKKVKKKKKPEARKPLREKFKSGKFPATAPKKEEKKQQDRQRVMAVAVSRGLIAQQTEIAKDAGLTLTRLAPESIALGDLVESSVYHDKDCCIITMGIDSTVIRIYRRYENIASHEINVGLRPIQELLSDHNFSFFEGNVAQRSSVFDQPECTEVTKELSGEIAYVLEYFADRGFYGPETEVFLAGEGALVPHLVTDLSRKLSRECRIVSELMKGKVKDEDAVMLAAAVGAGIFR